VQDDDAPASELANWHPQQEWAQKHAADKQIERSKIAAQAQPILSREVSALKSELAAKTGRLHAAAKQESVLRSEVQVWKSRFTKEKKQLLQTWRQGEKELGGREEAEKQALRLRKEVLADQEKVGKLSVELTSRKMDINLLQHQLSSVGTVGGIHALRAENKKLKAQVQADKAQVQADDAEQIHIQHVLALHQAISGTSTNKLKLKNEELSNLEKEMTEMTHRYAIQASQLKDAKQTVWKLASGGNNLKQATLARMRDQGVEALQQKTIDALRERLATVETESKGQGSMAESKIEVQPETKELKDLKAKLALVKKAEMAKSAKLAREVEALKSQASDVKTALSKVVQFSDRHALKVVHREKKEIDKLKADIASLENHTCHSCGQGFHDDKQVALLEKKRKEEAKLEASKLRVWAKGTNSNTSRTERLKALVGGDGKVPNATDMLLKDKEQVTLTAPRRAEKENMTEYIAKKREMFLVQMSLDTKREEIRKLEEKAQLKEEALQRSEQMLEEDAMRFDAFLKENDKKAHDAIKKAEEETKKKQEKSQEIKRLTQQIQALTSEMSKDSEALEDCLKYKTFLDMLSPSSQSMPGNWLFS
jgi:hypothetical protein